MKILVSEWIKTKRTPIRWLTFLTPVLFAAAMVWYFSLRAATVELQVSIFEAFFEAWSALVIPLGAGLISGMMIHQEELAGGFNGILGSKLPRKNIYLGKLTMLVLLALTSTFIAVLILLIGLTFTLHLSVSWFIFISAAIMAMLGTLPLLAFHLWISFSWGMGASIGMGGGGILIAALMATNLGNKVWHFVPWAWPVRLSQLAGTQLLNLPGMNMPAIPSSYIADQTLKGLIPAILLFIGLTVAGLIWFKKWEGRKITD